MDAVDTDATLVAVHHAIRDLNAAVAVLFKAGFEPTLSLHGACCTEVRLELKLKAPAGA